MLAIGPLNTANQATAWSRSVGATKAFSVGTGGAFARQLRRSTLVVPADISVPHYRLSPPTLRAFTVRQLQKRLDIFLNESNIPVGQDPRTKSFVDQLPNWHAHGIRTGIVFHGSDIRDPRRSMDASPFSYFHSSPADWRNGVEGRVRHNKEQVRESGLPIFVTTPDLLEHVEDAELLPLTININDWSGPRRPFSKKRLRRVLHQPSQRSPDVKGSRFIEPVLREMHEKGQIEYLNREVVSPSMMRSLILSADIVVDQLQTGAYGVTAVEALAAGKIVVANVESVLKQYGRKEIPIIHATPITFYEQMRELIGRSCEDLDEIAKRSREYAETWHDGRAAGVVLDRFVGRASLGLS